MFPPPVETLIVSELGRLETPSVVFFSDWFSCGWVGWLMVLLPDFAPCFFECFTLVKLYLYLFWRGSAEPGVALNCEGILDADGTFECISIPFTLTKDGCFLQFCVVELRFF